MDKMLAHIDIAQEDGGQNPDAASLRIKAKTDGKIYGRSSVGAESPLGGNLLVSAAVCGEQAGTATLTNVSGLTVSIPPNKSARIFYIGTFAGTATTGSNAGFNIVVTQGAGGSATVAYAIKKANVSAAADSVVYQGNTISIAAGTSGSFGNAASSTVSGAVAVQRAVFQVANDSPSAATTVTVQQAGTNNFLGSAIFALIS